MMKERKGLTIRNKITLSNFMIILLTLFVLGYVSFRVFSDHMLNRAVESSYTEMLLINNNLDNLINTMESQARLISINQHIQEEMQRFADDPDKSLDIIRDDVKRAYFDILLSNPMSMNVSLLTSQNRILYFGNLKDSSVAEIIDELLIQKSREIIKPQWTGLVKVELINDTYQDVFVVVKSIISRDTGGFLGTAFVYVDESHISDIYLNENIKTNSTYHIINNDGIVVSSNNKSELYKPYSQISEGYDATNILKSNKYEIISIGGVEYLQNTYYNEKLDWRIVNTLPLDEIRIKNGDVTQIIISVGIICSLVGILLSSVVAKSFTRPIYILSKSMQRVSAGEMNIRLQDTEISGGEIGELSRVFNELMDDIQSLMADVRKEQEKQHDYEFKLIQSQIILLHAEHRMVQ